jgi:hypothetical protein
VGELAYLPSSMKWQRVPVSRVRWKASGKMRESANIYWYVMDPRHPGLTPAGAGAGAAGWADAQHNSGDRPAPSLGSGAAGWADAQHNSLSSILNHAAVQGLMGRVNVNTASHPVLVAATGGNPSFAAAIIRSRPYIRDLTQGRLGNEILVSMLYSYGRQFPWIANYANILGVRSSAFSVVARGKTATLTGAPLASGRLEALLDRTEDRNLDGTPEVNIRYLHYENLPRR